MATKPDTSGYERFSEVTDRLDEIIAAVRDKETSLERSLDLFDEAIALGTRAVDLVDKAAFSPEEKERLVSGPEQADGGEAEQSAGSDAAGQSAGSDAAGANDTEKVGDNAAQQSAASEQDNEGADAAEKIADSVAQHPAEVAVVSEQASVNAESGDTSKQA